MTSSRHTDDAVANAVDLLEAHPDYRIIRRLPEITCYGDPDGRALRTGVVLDTETTGLDHDSDEVIELAMIAFEFDPESGEVFRVLDTFSAFEQPSRAIDAGSTAVHGITNDMVAGHRFDEDSVSEFITGSSIVIAHNARFDRPFVEARFPVFEHLDWGCSHAQVDWHAHGIGAQKLEHIAREAGIFYDAHRALADCRALLHVLQHPMPKTGLRALAPLIRNAQQAAHRLMARGSPFESKDILKTRGYRWDNAERCWHTEVSQDCLEDEFAWLREAVYGGRTAAIDVEKVDAKNRFSKREGVKSVVRL